MILENGFVSLPVKVCGHDKNIANVDFSMEFWQDRKK